MKPYGIMTALERQMIFEYWLRVLLEIEITIEDIAKIALSYADEYEAFDADLCDDVFIRIEDEGKTMFKYKANYTFSNGFGTFSANPGRSYHWKLKVIVDLGSDLNIGIIKANECENTITSNFSAEGYGYSYYAGGRMRHDFENKRYGNKYGQGDIIDIWLDLTKYKNTLSFGVNDEKFRNIKVAGVTDYKLAIGMYGLPKKIKLLSFEIKC